MNIDWIAKLRHLLQVLAFCMVVATVQYTFQPDKAYGALVVYSIFIGTITWAVIDLGREYFPSSAETGWPQGMSGIALVVGAIVAGYFLGTFIAGRVCDYYGLYPPGRAINPELQLRTSILITVIAGLIGSGYFYTVSKSAYLERKMGEARRHADEARLKLLETQLEPHMLFNTQANLRALISVDPVRAQTMLDHMIAYLRATLDASRKTTHSLQTEFDRLHDYLELMAIRMGPRLTYALELPAELADLPVPALLLQPLVENSIKHGLEPKLEGGHVRVTARRDGDDLVLEVLDTGVGPSQAASGMSDDRARANATPGGYGMGNVRDRLRALHGDRASLAFSAHAEGGSRNVLRIPAKAKS
ncbi:MAG: histidine kinase [Ramlibacter sp.]|nr:histidine kinase [Ramlibacter sp.]